VSQWGNGQTRAIGASRAGFRTSDQGIRHAPEGMPSFGGTRTHPEEATRGLSRSRLALGRFGLCEIRLGRGSIKVAHERRFDEARRTE
jgi:hypothetical protein